MRIVIIDLNEFSQDFENVLEKIIGTSACILDYKEIYSIMLSNFFYNEKMNELDKIFYNFFIPTDKYKEIINKKCNDLILLIQKNFLIIYPARQYRFELTNELKLTVYESLIV